MHAHEQTDVQASAAERIPVSRHSSNQSDDRLPRFCHGWVTIAVDGARKSSTARRNRTISIRHGSARHRRSCFDSAVPATGAGTGPSPMTPAHGGSDDQQAASAHRGQKPTAAVAAPSHLDSCPGGHGGGRARRTSHRWRPGGAATARPADRATHPGTGVGPGPPRRQTGSGRRGDHAHRYRHRQPERLVHADPSPGTHPETRRSTAWHPLDATLHFEPRRHRLHRAHHLARSPSPVAATGPLVTVLPPTAGRRCRSPRR